MQLTTNTSAFIEAQQYSQFILANLHDGLLPGTFYRNVSDFPAGTQLNINGVESTRAIQEDFETKFLKVAGITAQTAGDKNAINGFDHRWVADSGADNSYKIGLTDFIDMKLAFDKANVPQAGRIALVDPVVEATLNKLAGATVSMDRNPQFQGVLEQGFVRDHKFLFNLFGWHIDTSSRLANITAAETISHNGTPETAPIGSVANVFMNVLDDSIKPIMGAWRQMPRVEGDRNKDLARDEFVTRSRYGFGRQRPESLGVVLTSASNY